MYVDNHNTIYSNYKDAIIPDDTYCTIRQCMLHTKQGVHLLLGTWEYHIESVFLVVYQNFFLLDAI